MGIGNAYGNSPIKIFYRGGGGKNRYCGGQKAAHDPTAADFAASPAGGGVGLQPF